MGKPPSGYKKIPCHMIYDVKFDGRRKARFVAGGHLTMDPGEDAYAGVVAPDAVRLGMFAAVHNNLKVLILEMPTSMPRPMRSFIPSYQMNLVHWQGRFWSLTRDFMG